MSERPASPVHETYETDPRAAARSATGRVVPDLPPDEARSTDPEANIIPSDSPGG